MNERSLSSLFSVGFVLFIATLLAITGLFYAGSGSGLFEDRARFHFYCPSTSGLVTGSKVYLSGVPVGSVGSIELDDDLDVNKVKVSVAVQRQVARRVRQDSLVRLRSEGLLGDASVHISMGTASRPAVDEGGAIEFQEKTLLDDLAGEDFATTAGELMRALALILSDVQEGQGTVGQLLKNPELYESVSSLASSIDTFSQDLSQITREVKDVLTEIKSESGALGKLLFSPEYESDVKAMLAGAASFTGRMAAIAARVEAGEGTLGQLVTDGSLHAEAHRALARLNGLTGRIEDLLAEGERRGSVVARLLTDDELGHRVTELVKKLDAGAGSLEKILAVLERGEGSLGMALYDPSLAVSLRNVFLGVQEQGVVRSLLRSAERVGQDLEALEGRVAVRDRLEASRARALGRFGEPGKPSAAPSPSENRAEPVPAAAQVDTIPTGDTRK